MVMGIPTIWNPSEKNQLDETKLINRDDMSTEVKNLLVGTESDPHFKYVNLDDQVNPVELSQSISILNIDDMDTSKQD